MQEESNARHISEHTSDGGTSLDEMQRNDDQVSNA